MRICFPMVRAGVGTPTPLVEAIATILELAEPTEPVEVSLSEAVGLVLAESPVADVDLPPFDRAAASGYAVRSAEAVPKALLRVASSWSGDGDEVEPGEAARVEPGDALPIGADAVLGLESVRADPSRGRARVIRVLGPVAPGVAVVRRGATLAAGSVIAEAGSRLRPSMVAILAAQGCVHPTCHRRVRLSIVAVGEHLVGPADPPVFHRERNAANLAVGSLVLARGGMVHDLGSVAESGLPSALRRALNAHVVLILGRLDAASRRALAAEGVEPTVSGLAIEPGGPDVGHGVARDDDGRTLAHVVHLPLDPVAAVSAAALVVLPLLARLQGADESTAPPLVATWDAPRPATADSLRVVPAGLVTGADGRLRARPVVTSGPVDLPDFAHADGLALFPAGAGPWHGGELVGFVPFDAWPRRGGG